MRRYQQFVRPYSGRIYVALAFVLALIGASGTMGQWNNWILFRHGGNFGVTDPQFHKDVGFYVFELPFLTFIVDWTLAILIVTLAVSVVFHYFNGGIQPQRGLPRVRPPVKAHISVLLALIALDKAAGYVLQRWSLVNAQDGYVNGAGYTDVHARLPGRAAARLRLDLRGGDPALQHPAPGLDAAGVGRRDLGLRGAGRRHHLPGAAAGAQGHAGPELARGALHPAQHHGHAGRLRAEQRAGATVPGVTSITASQTVLATPDHRQHPAVGPGPDDLAADVPAPAGDQVVLPFPSLGVDRYTLGGQLTPVLIGVREISPPTCRPRLGSTRTCSTPTATAPPSRWPTRPTRATPSSRSRGCHRAPPRAAAHHPAVRLLRAGRDRLRRRQHEAARGRLPAGERQQRREPLHGPRRRPALVDLHPGRLRAAARRLQPPHLEPDHQQVADHVRAGPGRHGAEGGALPHASTTTPTR